MKTLLASILLSAISSTLFACGPYYPYGEDVRFSLFRPQAFNTRGLNAYRFTAKSFEPDDESIRLGEEMNCTLWQKRCGTSVSTEEIHAGIYGSEPNGPFRDALLIRKDQVALDYLDFANACSHFNVISSDPWERRTTVNIPKRGKLIREALKRASKTKDKDISLRYAFLAIRLAHYNSDFILIDKTYEKYFAVRKDRNIVDYWALYFRALTEKDPARRNFMAAQVFVHAPDKRFVILQQYDREIPLEKSLAFADGNEERSAVWALAGIRNHGKALTNIRNVQLLTPKSEMLSLLLLREVNKIEDWILTPYYSDFTPALQSWESDKIDFAGRISRDRAYAKALLKIVEKLQPSQTENPELWKSAEIYLHFLTEDYDKSLEIIRNSDHSNSKEINELTDCIRALCLNALQPKDSATILTDVKPVLLREYERGNDRFVFAIARELEYNGNLTEAALLLSKIGWKRHSDRDYEQVTWQYWRSKKGFSTLSDDVYYDYFFYLDAEYSPGEVKTLIHNVSNARPDDRFEKWLYADIKPELSRLYDLLGTKYMRKNKLKEAYTAFKSVNDTLWNSPHYPYKTYLDANPFYTDFYNEHTPTKYDNVTYNKESLVRKLIDYTGKAEDPSTKNRDYYYFLVANCHLNMTQYGNSWLMKRYYWSTYEQMTGLEDDEDYFYCTEAKNYYLKAKSVSKNPKFQALCLRMAGRCEKYKIRFQFYSNPDYDYQEEEIELRKISAANKYYKQLRKDYPQDYDELMGNCYSFDEYFEEYKR